VVSATTPEAPGASITWATLQAYQPEVLLLMPCGMSLTEAQMTCSAMQHWSGWQEIPAVKHGQVFLINGYSYGLRPGPRIVDVLELLAGLIHPDIFGDKLPPVGQVYGPLLS
jgi:iron complex transport system substrate-binding protein